MTVKLNNEALVTCKCGSTALVEIDVLRPERLEFGICSNCGRAYTLLFDHRGLTVKPGGVG